MKVLITGGAGFLGTLLARTLLVRGELLGHPLDQIVLSDLAMPSQDLMKDPRLRAYIGPLLEQSSELSTQKFDVVFHLAAAASAECEADFDLGMRSNLDTTRPLLEAVRTAGNCPRFIFPSTVAVLKLPAVVRERLMTRRDGRFTAPCFRSRNMAVAVAFMGIMFAPLGEMSAQTAAGSKQVQVGGLDVIELQRNATSLGQKLEFLSVTIFPGRGMNVFQIKANIPGKGETPLLKSPSVEEAAGQLTGTGKDQWGVLNHSFGGAFLIPYSSRISGEVSDGLLKTSWRGKTITLPVNAGKYSTHGLINTEKAENLKTTRTRDGETETGVIHAGDFGGHWLSKTDLHFKIALTGDALDISITATNVGKEAEPMAMGWHPYFSIPSGDRSQARLHVPAARRAVVNDSDGRTTGEFQPVANTAFDFRSPEGALLDPSINVNLSDLDRSADGFAAWLIDPKSSYGLRVKALSPQIETVQIYSPKNDTFVAIEDQFNYPDPWGKEWRGIDTGMATLHPGQSVTWRVRLELFSPGTHGN